MDYDEQLVRQSIAGEQESFRLIVEKYQGYVFAIIFKFIQEKDQAENVSQEVFIQIYRSLPQYRFQSLKSWIGKIAVTKAIDWRRNKSRCSREVSMGNMEEIGDIVESSVSNPEDFLILKEKEKRVREVCNSLPELYQRVILKFYLEEKSYQEIAFEEGVPVKTVESRLYRARLLFREKWEEGV